MLGAADGAAAGATAIDGRTVNIPIGGDSKHPDQGTIRSAIHVVQDLVRAGGGQLVDDACVARPPERSRSIEFAARELHHADGPIGPIGLGRSGGRISRPDGNNMMRTPATAAFVPSTVTRPATRPVDSVVCTA